VEILPRKNGSCSTLEALIGETAVLSPLLPEITTTRNQGKGKKTRRESVPHIYGDNLILDVHVRRQDLPRQELSEVPK
jgi:hypothetical protein